MAIAPENEFDNDDINLLKNQRYIKGCKQVALKFESFM